jgi:hypothetical protein
MRFCITVVLFFYTYQIIISQNNIPTFGERRNLGTIQNDAIIEASGIAASYKNIGVLWTHNDAGDQNRIFALDTNGNNLGEYFIYGVTNRDWEDIAVGPGPDSSKSYIYIGDIGDNNAEYTFKYIFRIEEPSVNVGQDSISSTILNVEKITFYYPDNPRNAEVLMIDSLTKDLYFVSKKNTKVRLYKIPYPQSTSQNIQAEIAAYLTMPNDPESDEPFNHITAGDISQDGNEILLKTYRNIYYWYRNQTQTIAEAMSADPQILPFLNSIDETQSEAVCWKPYGDKGYYTLSEENIDVNGIVFKFPANLYYYPRTSIVNSIEQNNLTDQFVLQQNYPNPFNPSTMIKYNILANVESDIHLNVFDILGRKVATLVNQRQKPGNYEVEFDGSNFPSGIYYYVLQIGNFQKSKKMVLLK